MTTVVHVALTVIDSQGEYNNKTLIERQVKFRVPDDRHPIDELKALLNKEFAATKEAFAKFPQPELPQAQRLEEIA